MSVYRAGGDARNADRLAPDHLPCCPRCDDLNDPGAARCASCNTKLYTHGAKPPRPLAVVQGDRVEKPAMEQWWADRHTAAELRELAGWVA